MSGKGKIDRKACRAFADPGLSFSPGCGLLHTEQVAYIVRSAVRNIGGRRLLILYFYDREKAAGGWNRPTYAVFQAKGDYATLQMPEDGKTKWREASLENLGERYGGIAKQSAFYRYKDEQIVTGFCLIPGKSGFDALEAVQAAIKSERLAKRIQMRERSIEQRMRLFPAAPRGLQGWIHREVLPHYIFYDYRRGNKPMQGYCTACRRDVLVSGARHNAQGACPHCRKTVTYKASGRAKRVWDRATVQSLQKGKDNTLVLRVFKVYKGLHDWRQPTVSVWENARFLVKRDEEGKMQAEAYYHAYSKGKRVHWHKGYRPQFSHYQYSFEADLCGHLFAANLDLALAGTPWQYSQLGLFCQMDREPLEVLPYLDAYSKYPGIEYLVKLGLTNLAGAVIYYRSYDKAVNPEGGSLRETLGVGAEDLPLLKKVNASLRQLAFVQELRKSGIRPDEDLLVWYDAHGVALTENVLIPLGYMSPGKLIRYIDGQHERYRDGRGGYDALRKDTVGRILSDFKDYLEMGKTLGYDFSDSFVLFPRNLQAAHDATSKLYDVKKNAIFNKMIRESYKGLCEQYRFSEGGLTLIPPRTAKEFVTEGHTLHHCVHSYVESAAIGKCVILFVRKTDSVKEPYYTLELRENRIVQIHGVNHSAPTPEVQKFLALWERKKLAPGGRSKAA